MSTAYGVENETASWLFQFFVIQHFHKSDAPTHTNGGGICLGSTRGRDDSEILHPSQSSFGALERVDKPIYSGDKSDKSDNTTAYDEDSDGTNNPVEAVKCSLSRPVTAAPLNLMTDRRNVVAVHVKYQDHREPFIDMRIES